MFDVIADVDAYCDKDGFIGVLVFWVYMYVVFYSIDRMKKAITTGKDILKSINELVYNVSFVKSSKNVSLSSSDLKDSGNTDNGVEMT